jgi:NADH pyrophosphatase NudC (nudix superfamily)
MPYTAFCVCCGKELHMRRKGERKYCSHHCYIVARYKDGGGND